MTIPTPIRRMLAGLSRRSSSGIGSGAVPSAPVLSGTFITPQTAIGLTAVFAAQNVISRDIASLPLDIYRKMPDGGLAVAGDHDLQEVLKSQPNDEMDAFRLRRDSMGHVLGWGNGLVHVVRDGRGYPVALHLLHPAKVKARRTDGGALFYEDQETKVRYPAEDVLHFAGLGFNGIEGYSPLTIARQSIGLAMAAEQFGAALFGNGAVPKGILKTPKKLGPQAATNLRMSVNQIHQGSQSAHQLMILEEGLEWVNTQINPDDAQFLATRQFQVVEIARLYAIPPHKIGDYSQAHLSNVEEANLDYLTTTLAGWLAMLEAQLNLKLLSRVDRQRFVIRHDMSGLLRGNMAARVAYYTGMRNMGCMSADDILRAEGKNPLGPEKGGDKYLVQMQYQPLEKAGEEPPAPAPAPPAKAAPAKPRSLRHNPNHGKDGKFASGHGASGGRLSAPGTIGGREVTPEQFDAWKGEAEGLSSIDNIARTFEARKPGSPKEAKRSEDVEARGKVLVRTESKAVRSDVKEGDHTRHKVGDTTIAETFRAGPEHESHSPEGPGWVSREHTHGSPEKTWDVKYRTERAATANSRNHANYTARQWAQVEHSHHASVDEFISKKRSEAHEASGRGLKPGEWTEDYRLIIPEGS